MYNDHKYPHVTVFTPINKVKDYILDEWMRHMLNLTYPNFAVVLVDNSSDRNYHREVQSKYPYVTVLYVDPKENGARSIITRSQNVARKFILDSLSDYAASVEVDVFPPLDFIERLMSHGKDMCAATYPIREGEGRKLLINTVRANRYEFVQRELPAEKALRMMDGKLKEIHSAGLGCVLFRREVLEKVTFRVMENADAYSDTYFFMDAHFAGYRLHLDTSFICRHESSDWKEKNAIVGK